jgi:hypothetical protein
MEFERLFIDDDGMTRIYATLRTHHHIRRSTQQIRDFSFSFVAPLSADYNNVSQGILV